MHTGLQVISKIHRVIYSGSRIDTSVNSYIATCLVLVKPIIISETIHLSLVQTYRQRSCHPQRQKLGCRATYEGVHTQTINRAKWVRDPFCLSTIDKMLNIKTGRISVSVHVNKALRSTFSFESKTCDMICKDQFLRLKLRSVLKIPRQSLRNVIGGHLLRLSPCKKNALDPVPKQENSWHDAQYLIFSVTSLVAKSNSTVESHVTYSHQAKAKMIKEQMTNKIFALA